ncbi:GNAT family N-acetyltransferase [Umezawaea endophytica]|uniref:GNAT family N-acetyltransferase n=1 Tax=Umezawaea endophytica TaxID=1654476 RepID=A0A9X3AI44_9PSEU|nr:GNAT family N-acetyltransferase [Umezawaea endophytica]MCS7480150.1 GNAT family N-acetyltransferase [Umezawaea endophytica]
MNDITIRPAHPDEWAAAGEITVAAYLADNHIDSHTGGYADQLANATARAKEAELLVAITADEVVGTVTIVHPNTQWSEVSREGELEFRMLAVAPKARGRGIGELLVQAAISRAQEQGAHHLVLSSSEHMETAHRLYTRQGFTRLPDRDWHPLPGLTAKAFILKL